MLVGATAVPSTSAWCSPRCGAGRRTRRGEAEARKSLAQTLNGLHTALQGVCELRNAYGFASHGSDAPRPVMEGVQALLAAQAADAIVGFLHRVHRQERVTISSIRLAYEDNDGFNTYLDDANEVGSVCISCGLVLCVKCSQTKCAICGACCCDNSNCSNTLAGVVGIPAQAFAALSEKPNAESQEPPLTVCAPLGQPSAERFSCGIHKLRPCVLA